MGDGTWQEIDRNCASGCATTLNKVTNQTTDFLEQQEDLVLKQPAGLIPSTTLVNVYPNPTPNKIFVQQSKNQTLQLTLLDLSGRLIQQKTMTNSTGIIDVANKAAGIYLLEILDVANGVTLMEKVVKQ